MSFEVSPIANRIAGAGFWAPLFSSRRIYSSSVAASRGGLCHPWASLLT